MDTVTLKNEYKLYHYKDMADAHKQGFNAGLEGKQSPYINPVNEYQKEYNRGHIAGSYIREK